MRRILTALAGIPILFVIIKYLPPAIFVILVLASTVLACLELYRLGERQGARPHRWLGTALAVLTAYSFSDSRLSVQGTLCAAVILIPLASLARAHGGWGRLQGEMGSIAVTLFGVAFVGLLMGYCLALLRDGGEVGRDLTVLLFFVVWLADAGALAAGSLWGRSKLAPAISPNKTLEGAAGALLVSVAATLVARSWFFTRLALIDALVLGLLLGVAGMAGDLTESLMKRTAAVKDSGTLFPGHGGVLDRTDSLLFAAPVLFYYHHYFLT